MIIVVSLFICFSLSMNAMEMDEYTPLLAPHSLAMTDDNNLPPVSLLPREVQNVISQFAIDEVERKRLSESFLKLLTPDYRVVVGKQLPDNKIIDLRDTYSCFKPERFEVVVRPSNQAPLIKFEGRVGRCIHKIMCCDCCCFRDEHEDDPCLCDDIGFRFYENHVQGEMREYIVQERCCRYLPPRGIFLSGQNGINYHAFPQQIGDQCGSEVCWINLINMVCCAGCCCSGIREVGNDGGSNDYGNPFGLPGATENLTYSHNKQQLAGQDKKGVWFLDLKDKWCCFPYYLSEKDLTKHYIPDDVPKDVATVMLNTHDSRDNIEKNKKRIEHFLSKYTIRKVMLLKQIVRAVEMRTPIDLRNADDAKEFEIMVPADIRAALYKKGLLKFKSWREKIAELF